MSDNIPEWLIPYIKSNSYIPTREDIENLESQSIKEFMLKYIALNSGGEEEDKYAAFKACVDGSLTEVTAEMLQGITSIRAYVFFQCLSLTSIEIPNSVTSIGHYAFCQCSSLTSIELPNSITSIGNSAFNNCTSLTSITIQNNVTSIGHYALSYCSSLASVTVKATTPPSLGMDIFNNTYSSLVIYVPAASVAYYKAASGWSSYASKIQAIPSS